jgi:hypothetical protein
MKKFLALAVLLGVLTGCAGVHGEKEKCVLEGEGQHQHEVCVKAE